MSNAQIAISRNSSIGLRPGLVGWDAHEHACKSHRAQLIGGPQVASMLLYKQGRVKVVSKSQNKNHLIWGQIFSNMYLIVSGLTCLCFAQLAQCVDSPGDKMVGNRKHLA